MKSLLGKVLAVVGITATLHHLDRPTAPLAKRQGDLEAKVTQLEANLTELSEKLDQLTGEKTLNVPKRSDLILGSTAFIALACIAGVAAPISFNLPIVAGAIMPALFAAIATGVGVILNKDTANRLRSGGQTSVAELGRLMVTGALFNMIAVVLLILSSVWQFMGSAPLSSKSQQAPQPSASAPTPTLTSPQIYLRCLPPPRQSGVWIYSN